MFTGAPCSGKTSVINALEKSGHRVAHEVARTYMQERLAQGMPIDKIKSDIVSFERHILQTKVVVEQGLPRNQSVFLDRAVPDSIAYFQIVGLSTDEPICWSQAVRYQHIFLFEQLEFEKDRIRREDQVLAMRLEELLINGYESLGYELIHVPLLSIDERVTYILDHLDGR